MVIKNNLQKYPTFYSNFILFDGNLSKNNSRGLIFIVLHIFPYTPNRVSSRCPMHKNINQKSNFYGFIALFKFSNFHVKPI